MADTTARRDPNRVPSLIGVDNITFEDTQTVAVNSDHEMLVSATVSIDGTPILDGVDPSIKATVKDLSNSNPLATQIVDASGDAITSFGGGTQYDTNVAYQDGDTGTLALTIRDDSLSTLTEADGDYSGLRVDSTGRLWANVSNTVTVQATNLDIRDLTSASDSVAAVQSGTWNISDVSGTVSLPTGASTLAEQQTQTTALGTLLTTNSFNAAFGTAGSADSQVMSIQGISSMTPVQIGDNSSSITIDYATTGSGTATGAIRVELPTNGTGVIATVGAVTAITNALPAGTNAIGKLAANSGVDIGDVDVTSIAAGTNNIGQVSVAPQTANGLSVFNATSSDGGTALTNSAQAIKASAGQLYGWYIYNPNSVASFVQFYNTAAASVTVGTTNPLFMLTIPPGQAANVEFTNGITFSNAGWSWSATSTAGGNGAPTTALDAVAFYK